MALVTKRVYPTEIPLVFRTNYDINQDTYTADFRTIGGVYGYWYEVTNRGSVTIDSRDMGYMSFNISTIKAAINAKFVYNITGTNSTYNATLLSGANMYYRISSTLLSINNTFGINSSGDIAITDLASLNFYGNARFDFEGFANGMNRKNTSLGTWQDSAVASISTFNNHWAVKITKNVDQAAQAHYIEYQAYEPVITNLAITGASIDNPIVATWTNEDVETWKLEALQNNIVVATINGTTQATATFPSNTLNKNGSTVFRLTASGSGTSVSQETTVNLAWTQAAIATLEPSGVNQNINLPIAVSWTATNVSQFKLTIDNKIYIGTTATGLTIPPNTLTSGTKTMTLDVTYQGVGYTTTATKAVTFLAYGNPPTPTLLNKAIISTATPLIKWDSTEQVAYDFKLSDGLSNIVVTGEVLSAVKQRQITTALTNNKTYTVKLKVKNQYGLWSEYATSTFTTNFVVPNAPVITGFADIANGSIVLNVTTVTSAEYKNSEIWRKEPYGEWVRMAYNLALTDTWVDNYVKGNTTYQYKARSIGITGGIAESDSISLSTTVFGYNFYNLENLNSNMTFKYDAEVIPTFNRNEVLTMYAGCNAPSHESDNIIYQTLSLSFTVLAMSDIDKFVNLIKTTKVFLYKDSKGRKLFGKIIGNFSPKTDASNITTIAFSFTELSFLERDVYAGANTGLKLLMWDGTWKFDSTYAFGTGGV